MTELSRDIHGPAQSRAIRDVLQTLFAAELLQPSKPLWLCFAWVTDLQLLDNSARQFALLQPDWPAAPIRLSNVLDALLARGGKINVVIRDHEHNETFITVLERLRAEHGSAIRWAVGDKFHAQGLLGERYFLNGSMNLTVSGVSVNEEHVVLRLDPALLAQQRLEFTERWEGKFQ
jgi:hypothetical protein